MANQMYGDMEDFGRGAPPVLVRAGPRVAPGRLGQGTKQAKTVEGKNRDDTLSRKVGELNDVFKRGLLIVRKSVVRVRYHVDLV